MSIETIARRYGTALADVVLTGGETETVKKELETWNELLTTAALQGVFGNPAIPHAKKERVLEQLIKKTKPSTTTGNFLRVMLRNNRLTQLAAVKERFLSVLEERSGSISAEIISARELPKGERAEFEKNLAKLTGKTVSVNYSIDTEIIGGVVTRIGSTVYDGSVKTKLENLKTELIGA